MRMTRCLPSKRLLKCLAQGLVSEAAFRAPQ